MNQTLKSLGLLLLSGCVLCAQDYLFQYQASVSVAANGDFQNPRVAPVDDRVYLVDGWMGLIVWDVADPSRPTPIGEYRPGETFNLVDVAAAGSTVYVIDDYDYSRLRILDFTDPLSPVELGVLGGADADPQLSYPSYVEQEGGLCFLWQPMWELQIVDVSDPTDPVVRATRNISECIDLAVQGNLVFLAMQSQGLTIWDVSDPSAVTEVGSYQLGEFQYANAIHVEGSTAYLATSEGLKVLDVANPSDPVLVESLHAVYAGADMAIANGFIFLNQFDGVRVFDATDLANVLDYGVTPFPTLGSAYQMVQQGDRLTLAATPDGLILADIASPPGIEFSGTTKGMAGGQEYETSEGLAVAVAGFGGITVIDESNPDNPFSINPLTLPGHCTGLARLGNVAYVAAGYAGLHVVDLSDPMSPLLSGTITTPGRPSDVAVFNDRLWVADGSEGMSVFEVSVAESPSLVTSLALPAGARHLTLAPPYAYVTGSYSQVSVLDLTDPANPSIVATFDTAGPSMRPEILGELLLLPEGQAGVEVFDVAIASAPERVVHLEFGA